MTRKHDDAHLPLRGRGERGNVVRKPANWGGAQLIEHPAPTAEEIQRRDAALVEKMRRLSGAKGRA